MAELKTKPTSQDVGEYLESIEDVARRADCLVVKEMMEQATGSKPIMWGESIVGFGSYRYRYASGRTGDWLMVGFSSRKQNLTLYFMSGFEPLSELLKNLGRYKTGKGCLYINRLADIDLPTLKLLIEKSIEQLRGTAGG